MSNATQETTNFVEVELCMELGFCRPTTDRNGELTFSENRTDSSYGFTIKCKVPKEVVANKETLTKYVREKIYHYETVSVDEINVWDSKKGEFLFSR